MARNMDQSKIIKHINAYLKKQHLPCQLNDDGVCNGLAALYVEYALRDESAKFKEILSFLATGKSNEQIVNNDEIDLFIYSLVTKIVVTYNPQKYYSNLSQVNAVELLDIEKNPLKVSFCFSAVVKDDFWEEILKDLSLQEKEVLQIGSANHRISLRKTKQGYEVYDPNYSQGYKTFTNEEQLVHELHHNVFNYEAGSMGLQLQVIRDPKAPTDRVPPFPDIKELYNAYLEDINAVAKTSGKEFSTLVFATANNDELLIKHLLDRRPGPEQSEIMLAAVYAARNNYDRVLGALVEKSPDITNTIDLLRIALKNGRKETTEKLFELLSISTSLEIRLSDIMSFISDAALGGNSQLLIKCITLYGKRKYPDAKEAEICQNEIAEMIRYKDDGEIIIQAIKSGNAETLDVLMNYLKEANKPLSDEEKLRYLSEAIRQNHFSVVDRLIFDEGEQIISEELLNQISMTTEAVKATNILILNKLKIAGMTFSTSAENIIAKHNEQSLTLIKSLGMALSKFTDFFREFLQNKEEKGIHIDPRFFKRELENAKSESVEFTEASVQHPLSCP